MGGEKKCPKYPVLYSSKMHDIFLAHGTTSTHFTSPGQRGVGAFLSGQEQAAKLFTRSRVWESKIQTVFWQDARSGASPTFPEVSQEQIWEGEGQ